MKFSLLTLALVTTAVAPAQSLRAQIEAANARVGAQAKAKDLAGIEKTMMAMTTPDFKYTEGKQTMGRKEMVTYMKMGIGSMKSFKTYEAKLTALEEKGDLAVATVRHSMAGTTLGADKKPHTMASEGFSSQTYVKRNGKWLLSRMSWLSQTTKVDGKPVPAGG